MAELGEPERNVLQYVGIRVGKYDLLGALGLLQFEVGVLVKLAVGEGVGAACAYLMLLI